MDDRAAVAAAPTTHGPSPLRTAARLVGAVFLIVGVLGFVPGITVGHEHLRFAGVESEAFLLGLFQVSVLHNSLHLLYGIAGFIFASTASAAHKYLILGGMGYLILAIIGMSWNFNRDPNFIPVNGWDDALHTVLGIGMIGLGYLAYRKHRSVYGPF
ncbi:DUF4383 domain-containing protein [Kineococcus xinjiangensis]|nr:DUF4383 domain-containing protein [Kineococcus xinjiangensis]